MHCEPQYKPEGEVTTMPEPERVKVNAYTRRENVAFTDFAVSIVTVQFPVPVHAPLQPENWLLESGAAVNVTMVPPS